MKSFLIICTVSFIVFASMTVIAEAASMNGDLVLICGESVQTEQSADLSSESVNGDLMLICAEDAPQTVVTTEQVVVENTDISETTSAPKAEVYSKTNGFMHKDSIADSSLDPAPVPEPGTVLLMSAGLIGLAGLVKRRNR